MNNRPPLYEVTELTDADYLHAVHEYELYIAAKRTERLCWRPRRLRRMNYTCSCVSKLLFSRMFNHDNRTAAHSDTLVPR